ncbi:MAG: carboxypeptidase-like regulatory domain-containing protein [Bacteroidota bacterium]
MFFVSTYCFAQVKITGRIIDEKTNEGIRGVSVYLNNSTYGTETNENGDFAFNCILTGKTSLIISHVSYERKVYLIEDGKVENLSFSLKPQTNNLSEVIIKSKHNKANLTKWINLFSENLIGVYDHSISKCKLKNPEALYFDYDKTENDLKIYAKETIVIENAFLNYKIKIDLDQFEYNFNNNEIIFKYFVFYEELPTRMFSGSQIRKNRKMAYEGSTMHFMRAVFKNNLETEGFEIYKYTAVRNLEKERVGGIIRRKMADAYAKEEFPDVTLSRFFKSDTLRYYQGIMKQDEFLKFNVSKATASEFTMKNRRTRTVNFNFADTLLVRYDKTKFNNEEKLAAASENNKDKPNMIKPVYLKTYLYFFKEGGINIENNGHYAELSLFMYGDMPERRIGISLPYDYNPDKVL